MTQEEFTHIASEMRANAVTVALKCGAAPADAEDIAQDVMLKLCRRKGPAKVFYPIPILT